MEHSRQHYATPSMWAWVPQDFRNKVIKQPMNRQIIGPALKPQNVYDNRKKDVPTIERETKIPLLAIICGSINFLIWIKVEVEQRSTWIAYWKILIFGTPKDASIIPI